MKKSMYIFLILALSLVLILVGCGAEKAPEITPTTDEYEEFTFGDLADNTDTMDILGGSPEDELVIGDPGVEAGSAEEEIIQEDYVIGEEEEFGSEIIEEGMDNVTIPDIEIDTPVDDIPTEE